MIEDGLQNGIFGVGACKAQDTAKCFSDFDQKCQRQSGVDTPGLRATGLSCQLVKVTHRLCVMAAARRLLLAAVLIFAPSSSPSPACPESCTCPTATLWNCSHSGLSVVPPRIHDSVTELDLSHNLLASVTLERPRYRLRTLRLGDNSLAHLSLCVNGGLVVRDGRVPGFGAQGRGRRCVSWAPALQLLSVERNQLEQLPQGLEASESLEVLRLSFNRISTLTPGELSHLRPLKELHLQHNLITSLHPQTFKDLTQLRVLDLSFNLLTSLHPLMYLTLRNIGADVRLAGNRWKCDCGARGLRRRMAYDRSRGLQAWSVVCDSPSILSGRDLLQLEEDNLNCFSRDTRPNLHQDVTVYKGSEILLSCSIQDSTWWTPSDKTSVSQPGAGLLINNIQERDTGLYVCMSEKHNGVSAFNLQISNKIGGTQRKTRSLSEASPEGTLKRNGLERNVRATQSDLNLAICLSVFITFLIAFILGVLARPCIDILWRKITTKKSSSATHTVSSVEQTQYDNGAYYSGEEPEETGIHSERRVTFGSVDLRPENNVQYYDTIASDGQESMVYEEVNEREVAEAGEDAQKAGDSGSENNSQQSSPRDNNEKDDRDRPGVTDAGHTQDAEFENIADSVVLERPRRSSSCSDSSLSDKELKEDQMIQRNHTIASPPQLAEDSVQQRSDPSTIVKLEVPQNSSESRTEVPGFSTEPFTNWSPHANKTNLSDLDAWRENEEQFEFSDSVRSSVSGSFNNSKLNVALTSAEQKRDDMSSSSSFVSEDEPTHYTVNSDEEVVEKNLTNQIKKRQAPLPPPAILDIKVSTPASDLYSSGDSDYETIHIQERTTRVDTAGLALQKSQTASHVPEKQFPVQDLQPVTRIKRRLDIKASSPAAGSSSGSESEDETVNQQERPRELDTAGLAFQESQTASNVPGTQFPTLDLDHATRIKRRLDIKVSSPASGSSSGSDSEVETTHHQERPVKVDTAGLEVQKSQTTSHVPEPRWPLLDLEHTTRIKRRLDVKAPAPDSDSSFSSDSEYETIHTQERPVKVDTAGLEFQKSQTPSNVPETQFPTLDLKPATRIKKRLDIKVSSPALDSSSGSDSEDETIHTQERPVKVDTAGLAFQKSQTASNVPETQFPTLDLDHATRIKRRLDIKVSSPASDSSSGSDSEVETTHHQERPVKVDTAGLEVQKSQTASHVPEPRWPLLDLEHTTRIKRRLDVKAPAPDSDSSFSSDSEYETIHTEERPVKVDTAGLEFQKSQTPSNVPETQFPTLDLKPATRIKKRLDIKVSSPAFDSSSGSDSEDETIHTQERPVKVDTAGLAFQKSQTASNVPETQFPTLDLDHATRIKRRLDIKVSSPASDSSSSSDSEVETTHHQDRPVKVDTAGLEVQKSQTASPESRWPLLDLEHTTRIKRRLDVKARAPDSDSSFSSDSEYETIHTQERPVKVDTAGLEFQKSQTPSNVPETQSPALDLKPATGIKKRLDIKVSSPALNSSSGSDSEYEKIHTQERPVKVDTAGLAFQKSQTASNVPGTQFPALDLDHATRIKRRLDIKVSSPASDSSSGSDSEVETTHHQERPVKVDTAGLAFQKSPTASHVPEPRWPLLDLEYTTRIKRRLDVKAPAPDSDSSSLSDSNDETSNHIKKQAQEELSIARHPTQVSQTVRYDPQTQLAGLDLGQRIHVKRRLDIKAPSPDHDSSSSSDSEDGTSNHIKKQGQEELYTAKLPNKVSGTVSYDLQTQWPDLDLEHSTRVKRRLDIKEPSKASELSGSSDSEDERTFHQEIPRKVDIEESAFQRSQTAGPVPETRWPLLDLEHTRRIKRRLEMKAASPASDAASCSSSDSEDGTTRNSMREGPGVAGIAIQKSQTSSHDSERPWPAVDFGNLTRVKRRLDIKAPSPRPESSHTVVVKREEAIKLSPNYSSISSKEQDVMKDLNIPPTTLATGPDSRWPELGPISASHVKRRLDIKVRSPPLELSSSSDESEGGTTDIPLQTKLHDRSLGVPYINRRLDIKAPSAQSQSNSSGSDSEDGNREQSILESRVSAKSKATENEFTMSPKSPVINIPRSAKTDQNIKLEKYDVITDDVERKTTSGNASGTPAINPELESRWATMNLGVSRFRKRLQITSHSPEQPKLPTSPPPDSPVGTPTKHELLETNKGPYQDNSSVYVAHAVNITQSQSQTEKAGGEITSRTTTVERDLDSMQPNLSLTSVPHIRRALDIKAPIQRKESLSSNSESDMVDHSSPDLSRGVPRIKRRLNVKAPIPSDSPSSCSESEHEVSISTDYDALITYKRLIIRPSSPPNTSLSLSGQTMSNAKQTESEIVTFAQKSPSYSVRDRHVSPPRSVLAESTTDLVEKMIERSGRTTHVDLPPGMRWTGVGRQLSDSSYPQQGLPAEQELRPPYTTTISSSKIEEKIIQDRIGANVTPKPKYTSLSLSSGALDKLYNSSGRTIRTSTPFSEEKSERKGLSALKAMSLDRRDWDTQAQNVDISAPGLFDDNGSQVHKPSAKQPLTQSYLSSTSLTERTASDGLYGIPRYRRHDFTDMEPPQEAPPPVPSTPLPDETLELTWNSPQSSKKPGLESTRYLQQSRNTGESDTSSPAVYSDSYNISHV